MDYRNYEFPLKAKCIRHKNRIYFSIDFEDGEEISYYGKCEQPNANANGYRYYQDSRGNIRLVHISEIVGCE